MLTRVPLRAPVIARALRLYSNGRVSENAKGRQAEKRATVKSKEKKQDEGIASDRNTQNQELKTPSLYEQLFPDQREEVEAERQDEREIPRVALEQTKLQFPPSRHIALGSRPADKDVIPRSRASERLEDRMKEQGSEKSVLVLRNASKNLVEEDFRRLVPRGQHLEGWRQEQDNILKVVPGRNLATLEQENFYYILFSSALAAFKYQGHASEVHRLVSGNMPSSVVSPIAPPPGYKIDGMDAQEAIQSFTLVPPTQHMELRQLQPPLTPLMDHLVQKGGYPALVRRKDRMRHELRLTLEGPQLGLNALRHVFILSAEDRKLSWSGGDETSPKLTKWEPLQKHEMPSPMSTKRDAVSWADAQMRMDEEEKAVDATAQTQGGDGGVENGSIDEQKRRTPTLVYIAGFHTERAMQSFKRFWHRRSVEWEGFKRVGGEDGDLAPVVNVEVLW